MPVSRKIADFIDRASWIRAMFETGAKLKAEKGAENVFDFSLGNPILDPPEAFYEVMSRLNADRSPMAHGYMPNAGYPQVRAKVAAHLSKQSGVNLDENDVLMTVGAGGGLNVVLKTILDPGAEVVVPTPYFVEYDFYLDNHGGKIVRVPTHEDFTLDLSALKAAITDKTYAILLNNPNNPTGAVYARGELEQLAAMLTQKGQRLGRPIYLISDEPYRQIAYDGIQVPDIFALYPQSLVVTSFSKSLSLAGERIGYVAVHPKIADKKPLMGGMVLCNRILGFVNAPGLMQKAVAELLEITSDMTLYAKKRELICQVLTAAGFTYVKPMGAFYVFPQSPIPDDVKFVKAALAENLLLVPGSGFMGPGHFRIAFCVANEVIERSAKAFKRVRERF